MDGILNRFSPTKRRTVVNGNEEMSLCDKLSVLGYIEISNRDYDEKKYDIKITEAGLRFAINGGFKSIRNEHRKNNRVKNITLILAAISAIAAIIAAAVGVLSLMKQ